MDIYFLLNSLAGGGAQRVAVNLSKILPVKRFLLLEREIKYEIPEEKIVFLSSHRNKTNPILKTFYIPLYAKSLSQRLEKNSLVISFLERANYVNILAKPCSKHRAFISIRMSQLTGRKMHHPYNFSSKLLYPKADMVICASNSIAEELKTHYKVPEDKLLVIYNPIYIDEIKKFSKESSGEYESIFNYPALINSGRLTKQKGQWYLLRIFKELKKEFPEQKLLILGEGELKEYLVGLSKDLGLKTYVWDKDQVSENFDVYFLGFQKNPFKFIARSKLFVFPSFFEGFPNALAEAMACRIAVVSSDCRSGPREILAPNTDFEYQTKKPEYAEYGILMPVFEVKFKRADEPLDNLEKMWVETLRELLKREELIEEYGYKALQRALDFDIGKIAEEWKKVLREVL